jgi:hypothetical protein
MTDTAPDPFAPNQRIARIVVILVAVAQIAASALPALGIGTPVGARSDRVQSLITPAGWAFSIWGALYIGSIVFACYQALPAQRDNRLVAKLRWPAAGTFLGNACWATYVQLGAIDIVSVLIIAFSLLCILRCYRQIAAQAPNFSSGERWAVVIPLCALASWLTVASIVNVAASLRFHGVDANASAAGPISALVIIVGGIVAGTALARSKGNIPYAAVFLWALAAIFFAGGPRSDPVALASASAAMMVVIGVLIGQRKVHAKSPHPNNL